MIKRIATGGLIAGVLAASPVQAYEGLGLPTALPGLETAPPFNAEISITSATLQTPTTFKIYYMPQRVRMESRAEGGMLAIMRMDQGVAYVHQGDRSWLRLSLSAFGAMGLSPGSRASLSKLPNQTVDGRACEVYQSTSADGTVAVNYMAGGLPFKSVVRPPTGGTTTVRYLNVSRGGVHEGLFDVPAQDEVMDMNSLLNGIKKGRPSLDLE